jgi:4-amino-4-deoxy-L-arabinose transferase-like glycosyltransferase
MSDTGISDAPPGSLRVVVGVGAAVRIAYWLTKWNHALLLNDSWYYSGQARQLAQGTWFRELFVNQPGAEHGPLTSLLMAPVSYGANYWNWQRLVTVATGIALVWVIGRLAHEWWGPRVAVVAAGIAAVYPNLWMNDGLVMSESISMLLVALSLWAAWRAAHAPVEGLTRSMLVLGGALGLATLARSELALFVPLVLVWVAVVRRRSDAAWRPVVLGAVVAALVVAPWVGFNLARFERPVLLTTNDGTTLLGANCDDVYHGTDLGGWSIFCVTDANYRQDEEPSVRSARQRSQALHYARSHLRSLPRVATARVARTLDLYGFSNLVHQDTGEERPEWAVWVGIVMFWLLAAAAILGARRANRRLRWLLAQPMLVALATTVLFYGAHRIRSSAEPAIVLLAAVGVVSVLDRWTATRHLRQK